MRRQIYILQGVKFRTLQEYKQNFESICRHTYQSLSEKWVEILINLTK